MSGAEAAILKAGLALLKVALEPFTAISQQATPFLDEIAAGNFTSDKVKTAVKNLVDEAKTTSARAQRVRQDVGDQLALAKQALDAMQAALNAGPGQMAVAADELVRALEYLDKALLAFAKIAAEKPDNSQDAEIYNGIVDLPDGVIGPVKKQLKKAGEAVTAAFDDFAKQLFGIDGASGKIADNLKWARSELKLSAEIKGPSIGLAGDLVRFHDTKLKVFAAGKPAIKVGITLAGNITVKLSSDPVAGAVMAGDGKPEQTPFTVTLDTKKGLTFGEGEVAGLPVPVKARVPGVELRDFSLAKLPSADSEGLRLSLAGVIAAKLGGVLSVVVQGVGVEFRDRPGPLGWEVKPDLPNGMGFSLDAGPIRGGGFLQRREAEQDYGGAVSLAFGPVDVFAMALFSGVPSFSFVTVLGVRFTPAIELGFGFTLNGVGGIAALNRTLSMAELTAGLKDGVVSSMLFPADPIAAAPKTLASLGKVFPIQAGAFVFGPIAELGWGSQLGIVRAKIGVVVAPPDPQVVILGSASIQVPPDIAGAAKLPKYIDLKLDILAVISASQLYVRAALTQSKIAGMAVTGDLGALVRWAGSAEFAISAGGFFPGYKAPAELADLRRLAIPIKSPVPAVKLNASGYFALTSNSVQLGGQVDLWAKAGPVTGTGHFGLDALFQWSPTLHFVFDIRAGIKLAVSDFDVAGVSFSGRIEGTSPWRLQGKASIEVLWWDIDFDLGPYTWGDPAPVAEPQSALALALKALNEETAWSTRTAKVRRYQLRPRSDAPKAMVEGGGVIRVTQSAVPFDTPIDRIGSVRSKERRLAFAGGTVGGVATGGVGQTDAPFAMGQFQDLTRDQQLAGPAFEKRPAGMELAPVTAFRTGPVLPVDIRWETRFPEMPGTKVGKSMWDLSKAAAKLIADTPAGQSRQTRNPYLPVGGGKPGVAVKDGARQIARTDRLQTVGSAMSAAEARHQLAKSGGEAAGLQLVTAGAFQ